MPSCYCKNILLHNVWLTRETCVIRLGFESFYNHPCRYFDNGSLLIEIGSPGWNRTTTLCFKGNVATITNTRGNKSMIIINAYNSIFRNNSSINERINCFICRNRIIIFIFLRSNIRISI